LGHNFYYITFEVFAELKIKFVPMRVMATRNLSAGYQHFGAAFYIQLQGRSEEAKSSFEIFVAAYKTTWCHNPDHNLYINL
jgi:hypothetical protein